MAMINVESDSDFEAFETANDDVPPRESKS